MVDDQDVQASVFARKLIEARRGRSLSQQQLADLVGVERKTISRWETGTTKVAGSNVIRAAEVLDWTAVDIAEILGADRLRFDPFGGMDREAIPIEVTHLLILLRQSEPSLREAILRQVQAFVESVALGGREGQREPGTGAARELPTAVLAVRDSGLPPSSYHAEGEGQGGDTAVDNPLEAAPGIPGPDSPEARRQPDPEMEGPEVSDGSL